MPCSCGESKCFCCERCFCPPEFCMCISCLCITENEITKSKSDTASLECSQITSRTSLRSDDFPESKNKFSPSKGCREYTEVLTTPRVKFEDFEPNVSDNFETETKRHNNQLNVLLQAMSSSESEDCEIVCEKIGNSCHSEKISAKQEDNLKRKFDSVISIPEVPVNDGLFFPPYDTSYSQRKRGKISRKIRKSDTNNFQENGKETNISQTQQKPRLTFQKHTDLTVLDNTGIQTRRCRSNLSIPVSEEFSYGKVKRSSTHKSVADVIQGKNEKGVPKYFNFPGCFLQGVIHDPKENETTRTSPVLSHSTTDSRFPESVLGVYTSPESRNNVYSSDKIQIDSANTPDVCSIQNMNFTESDNNEIINPYSSLLGFPDYELEFQNDCEIVYEENNIRKRLRSCKNGKMEESYLETVLQNNTTEFSKSQCRRGSTNNIKEFGKETNISEISQQRSHLTFKQHTDLTLPNNTGVQTDRLRSTFDIPVSEEFNFAKLFTTPKSVADITKDNKEKGVSKSSFLLGVIHDHKENEITRTSPVLNHLTNGSRFTESALGVYTSPDSRNSVHSSDKNTFDVSSVQNTNFTMSHNEIINQYGSLLGLPDYESEFQNDCEVVHEKKNIRKGIRKSEEAYLENVRQNNPAVLSKPQRRRRRRRRAHCKRETFKGIYNKQNEGLKKNIKMKTSSIKREVKTEKRFFKRKIKKESGFIKKEIKKESGFIKKEIKREKGFIKKEIKKERP